MGEGARDIDAATDSLGRLEWRLPLALFVLTVLSTFLDRRDGLRRLGVSGDASFTSHGRTARSSMPR